MYRQLLFDHQQSVPEVSILHHRGSKIPQSVSCLLTDIMKWPTIKMGSPSSRTGDNSSEAESTRDLDAIEKLIGRIGCGDGVNVFETTMAMVIGDHDSKLDVTLVIAQLQ